jgi:hypothetical protein
LSCGEGERRGTIAWYAGMEIGEEWGGEWWGVGGGGAGGGRWEMMDSCAGREWPGKFGVHADEGGRGMWC